MSGDVRSYLHDMAAAADLIQTFTAGRSYATYSSDPMLRSAVERQFEIMGEALTHLARKDPAIAERVPEHRRVIAFRNILAHGYSNVDDRLVWDIVESKLPTLRQAIAALIDAA